MLRDRNPASLRRSPLRAHWQVSNRDAGSPYDALQPVHRLSVERDGQLARLVVVRSAVESRKGAVRGPLAAVRFLSPLIKPDVRISRIRLSDRLPDKLTQAEGGAAGALRAIQRFP